MRFPKIPNMVIKRLPLYLRILTELENADHTIVSSHELGRRTGLTSAQVRKDLTYFGEFGRQGVGYDVRYLRRQLEEILGLDHEIRIALIGVGHLGLALARYNMTRGVDESGRTRSANPRITALFDTDVNKIGTTINGIAIRHTDDLVPVCNEQDITMAIITVPGPDAQKVLDTLAHTPVKAVLNFSPVKLNVPKGIRLHNSDLTVELQSLAYYASRSDMDPDLFGEG